MIEGVERAGAFLLVLTKSVFTRPFCRLEIMTAIKVPPALPTHTHALQLFPPLTATPTHYVPSASVSEKPIRRLNIAHSAAMAPPTLVTSTPMTE